MDKDPIVRFVDLRQTSSAKTKLACVVHARHNSWRQADDLREIPGDEREIADSCLIDHAPQCRRLGLKRGRRGDHVGAFMNSGQPKVQLQANSFCYRDTQIRASEQSIACLFNLDFIDTWWKQRKDEITGLV